MLIHFFGRPIFPVDVAGHVASWAALLCFSVMLSASAPEALFGFQRIFPAIAPAVVPAWLAAMFVKDMNEFALECANER